MSTAAALPFLTIPEELIQFSGWEVGDVGQALVAAGDLLENWDYARDLEVAASVSISWAAVANYLSLPADKLWLRVALLVGTGSGRLPRRLARLHEVVLSEQETATRLSAIVKGAQLSGQLRLALTITLEGLPPTPGKLSPRVPGSRLWQSYQDVLIEDGGASRFPIEAVSFSKAFKGLPLAAAPWYLHWEPAGLQGDFAEQVRLYVNSDREEVFARFRAGDEPTLQVMLADVISQMVSSALDVADSEELLAQCDEGSVGNQIRLWISMAFPSEEISSIRALKERSPGKFRALILGMAELQGTN